MTHKPVSVRDLEQTVREGLRVPPRPCLDCTHDECFCERSKVLGGESLSVLVRRLEAAEAGLRRIELFPVDVMCAPDEDLLEVKEIARAALAGAADPKGTKT